MFPRCAEQGVGFTTFSPPAGGWLTGKYGARPAFTLKARGSRCVRSRIVTSSALLCSARWNGSPARRARGVEVSSLALACVLHQPRVDAAIIRPRNLSHLTAALAATSIALTGAEAQR